MNSGRSYFVGVDVGTQSVRAGLVTSTGKVVSVASSPIKTWNPFPNVYEQSSDLVWELCTKVIKEVTKDCSPSSVKGIGFDATCSLVILDKEFKSLSVSSTGNCMQNIILWMDHRAKEEADFINSQHHEVLKYVGGKISPEMEPPKLLWLKKNLPAQWERAGHFFDLPDFLTMKATQSLQRSLCSLVCKWTYVAGEGTQSGWQNQFWTDIGLEDLVANNFEKIGSEVLVPGECCGSGLSQSAAEEMGLKPGTPVSASMIDAHAGGIGVLGCTALKENIEDRLALICGTSTCHMKVQREALFTPGVWGPYYSAMVPEYWCSEAGQSAAGALLDHVVKTHPAAETVRNRIATSSKPSRHIADELNEAAERLKMEKDLPSVSFLTKDFHVYPDYHGNRSPLANPNLKGMLCGLTLFPDEEELVKLYVATLQALAYNTKHILSALNESGHTIKCLLVCGGLAKNPLYVKMHADITGLPVVVPDNCEPVLLGSAILGASAADFYPSVLSAMEAMCGTGTVVKPEKSDQLYHEMKYKVFQTMLSCQLQVNQIMDKEFI